MKRKIFSVLLTLVLVLSFSLMTAVPVSAAATVTAATGGDAISADTAADATTPAWTTLGAITISEGASGDIAVGDFVLTIPSGFEFNTASVPDVAVTGTTPQLAANTPAAITATTITVTVTAASSTETDNDLIIGGITPIQVRPTTGTPLATEDITMTSGTIAGVTGTTNFGTLGMVVGALDEYTVVPAALTQTAGTAFDVTITAVDQFDTLLGATYATDAPYVWTTTAANAPDGTTPNIGTLVALDFTNGVATKSVTLYAAETGVTFTATDASAATGTSDSIDVDPAAFAEYTVVPAATTQTAGSSFEVTVTAVDEYQNPSPSGIDDTTLNSYTYTFSGPGDAPDSTAPTYPTTADFTTGAWSENVTLVKAEAIALTVEDDQATPMSGTSATITVDPADAASLTVTGITDPVEKATASDVIVTAYDGYENTATGYTGEITFTSTDTAATLPADYTFLGGDNGVKTFANGVTFQTVGQQSVTAADTTTSSINGTQSGIGVYDLLITLNADAWTLISTDDYLITSGTAASAWEGTASLAYKYEGSGYLSATMADLEPVEAVYVKMTGSGEAGLNYSTAGSPGASIKSLVAGWNLVSSATGDEADIVLSPLRYVQIGEQEGTGLATLVSQSSYNLTSGDWYVDATDWTNLTEAAIGESMDPFDGYWVYMNAAKSFGVIP